MGEKIREALGSNQSGIDIAYSLEPKLLGTGGAVKKIKAQLEQEGNLLVINSDCIFLGSLSGLAKYHIKHKPVATLAVAEDPDKTYTPVCIDEKGLIIGIGNSDVGQSKRFMFLGAHAVSSRAPELFPENDAFGIIREAYLPVLKGVQFRAWNYKGAWLDCGTNALYLRASNFLLDNPNLWLDSIASAVEIKKKNLFISRDARIDAKSKMLAPVFIGEGASIENSEVGPYVVVGKNSTIKNSRLKSGIIWPETRIQKGELENFIATPFVTVSLES